MELTEEEDKILIKLKMTPSQYQTLFGDVNQST